MDILGKLGINGKILLAQVVNFFLLLYVLKRFLYGPLLRILQERENKIKRGLEDAEKAQKKFEEADKKIQVKMEKANQKIDLILAKAYKESKEYKEDSEREVREKIKEMKEEAQKYIENEKRKITEEVKKKIGPLVVAVAQKIITQRISEKDRMDMIKETQREITKIKKEN
ncbi:MAG: F0F1 ATP synthase subunit B [Candidatus Moranbacteria bacterium]|nr:F0F1 ATP synthase subunit B [Candidatus Moranbacteria bacterium]